MQRLTGTPVAFGWFVAPMAAATLDQGQLLLGWPYYEMVPDAASMSVRDSSGAGLLLSRGADPMVVRQPVSGRLMENPRLRRVAADTVDVVFSARTARSISPSRVDSIELWSGRIVGGAWQHVQRIARFPKQSADHRQVVGDGVSYRGELIAGLIARSDAFDPGSVVLVEGAADRWRVSREFPWATNATYLDLTVFRDTLWLVAAAKNELALAGDPAFGLWLSYRGVGGWSSPRLVGTGDAHSMREPRLLGSVAGLVISWIDDDRAAGTVLRWRGVDAGIGVSTQAIRIATFSTRGAEAFGHLLSAARDDSTALILELTPTAGDVLAEVPTIAGIPALVFGAATRPIAVGPLSSGPTGPIPLWLSEFDLTCTLRPTPTGR